MNIDYPTMLRELSQYVWPLGRISGLVAAAPAFSSAMIPSRIKVILIFALTIDCTSYVPAHLSLQYFNGLFMV